MDLPPYFDELILEPEDMLFAEPLTCACCGGTTQTAFLGTSSYENPVRVFIRLCKRIRFIQKSMLMPAVPKLREDKILGK
jgi:hypothetical protein